MVIKQIPRETDFAPHILTSLMEEFPLRPQNFHIAHAKIADQIRFNNLSFSIINKKK